jgi:hypothetical protein
MSLKSRRFADHVAVLLRRLGAALTPIPGGSAIANSFVFAE